MQITFKSGTQVEVDATEFTTTRSPITGELTKINWTTPDGWTTKLHTVDVGEVAAIVGRKVSHTSLVLRFVAAIVFATALGFGWAFWLARI